MAEPTGNLLVLQTGVPSAVANSILCGIIEEAVRHDRIEEIYGVIGGAQGLPAQRFIDLGQERRKTIEALRRTPGAALRSGSARLNSEELAKTLAIFKTQNVQFILIAGGIEAVEIAHALDDAAKHQNQSLTVLAIAQSPFNEVPETDHCPGYGSAARWVAFAARDLYFQATSLTDQSPVMIIEIAGATGWLPAAAGLSKEIGCAPDFIYLPERPVDQAQLLERVQQRVNDSGKCVIVMTGSSVRGSSGDWESAQALSQAITQGSGLGCDWSAPGGLELLSQLALNRADFEEAISVGQTAVRAAVDANTGYLITLKREAGTAYKSIPGTARLEDITPEPRTLPDEFINEEGNGVTEAFLEYVRPLAGGPLPDCAILQNVTVEVPS